MLNETEVQNRLLLNLSSLLTPLEIIEIKQQPTLKNGITPDLLINARYKNKETLLLVEIKSLGEPRYIERAISQVKRYSNNIPNSYPMVAASCISKKSKEICKELSIGYIDLAGNILIDLPSIHIEKESKEIRAIEEKRQRYLFSPVSTRIIRALLIDPKKNWSIKFLSEHTHVSLGYTHRVVEKLLDEKFLHRNNTYRLELHDPERLLNDWRETYSYTQNTIHGFFTFEKNKEMFFKKLVHTTNSYQIQYALTLHSGASFIAPYVRFTDIHFYVFSSSIEILKEKLDLRPVESGANLYLIEPYDSGIFLGKQTVNELSIVSNIQLYLDLYNYPKRGREQAEFLREKKLQF